jgi:hypothetical protein
MSLTPAAAHPPTPVQLLGFDFFPFIASGGQGGINE